MFSQLKQDTPYYSGKDYTTINSIQNTIDSTMTLKSVSSFPIGVAFNSAIIANNPENYKLFLEEFNSKTVHTYMNIEPLPDQFKFKEPDYWVDFAKLHPIRLHGHCLIYHISAPTWWQKFGKDRDGFEKAIENHIRKTVGRYRGKIKSWDVINEMFAYNSGSIRSTIFRKYYDNDQDYLSFVKRCFQWAHEADPNALLFYNDFSLEYYPKKVQAVLQLVADFKRSGTPIHGIGTQMHITFNANNKGIENSLQELASTGLQVHISELDIQMNPKNASAIIFSNQFLSQQRNKYETVAILYKKNIPVAQQYGITLWDFSDADSWYVINKKQHDIPNIFDKKYRKKPAYYGLLSGLK
ncbi:endo-1,4-beta-xylanase [Larkinella sp. GY13]|uniref:endo-1,4-beta-xylanase n=1 Tax=Larkinella sp. GY13 TaxID=3453720 RepID=UPI003EECEAD5